MYRATVFTYIASRIDVYTVNLELGLMTLLRYMHIYSIILAAFRRGSICYLNLILEQF
jgi:hypothetical protein